MRYVYYSLSYVDHCRNVQFYAERQSVLLQCRQHVVFQREWSESETRLETGTMLRVVREGKIHPMIYTFLSIIQCQGWLISRVNRLVCPVSCRYCIVSFPNLNRITKPRRSAVLRLVVCIFIFHRCGVGLI